jgi:hypothetical protein
MKLAELLLAGHFRYRELLELHLSNGLEHLLREDSFIDTSKINIR